MPGDCCIKGRAVDDRKGEKKREMERERERESERDQKMTIISPLFVLWSEIKQQSLTNRADTLSLHHSIIHPVFFSHTLSLSFSLPLSHSVSLSD